MVPRLRVLISYGVFRGLDLDRIFAETFTEPYPEVMADCGAYTALTRGIEVTVEGYLRWLSDWKHLIQSYANLDVIGNARASMENLKAMEAEGFRPIPVYHGGEPVSLLEELIERYSYIAIGGMTWVAAHGPEMERFLVDVFHRAKGHCALHGFGNTYWPYMRRFPWYSVDGSTWLDAFRYGKVMVFDQRRGRFWMMRLREPRDWARRSDLVKSYGFDWKEFAQPEGYAGDYEKLKALVGISYYAAERWLRSWMGEVPWWANQGKIDPAGDPTSGPKIYLALSKSTDSTVARMDQYVRQYYGL